MCSLDLGISLASRALLRVDWLEHTELGYYSAYDAEDQH